jgi:hypothetical protein
VFGDEVIRVLYMYIRPPGKINLAYTPPSALVAAPTRMTRALKAGITNPVERQEQTV